MNNWSLTNPPPPDSPDVGEWAWSLYEDGQADKERLSLPETWLENYRLYSGDHWPNPGTGKLKRDQLVASLIFANVERTVANLAAKTPVVEVVEIDGEPDDVAPKALTAKVKGWWGESEQAQSLVDSVKTMETYGPTIEKYIWNPRENRMETVIVDPFAFGMCPGNWQSPNDAPYCYHILPMRPDEIASAYGVEERDIEADDIYSLLCEEREERVSAGTTTGSANLPGNYSNAKHASGETNYRNKRALVVELWIRDNATETVETVDDEGNPVSEERQLYPGGIRVIRITNRGKLVLSDDGNPNINPELPREMTSQTWLYNRVPFGMATSYRDMSSPWGFSAAIQTGELCRKIGELLSRIYSASCRSLLPTLVVPLDTGIKLTHLNNRPGLILQPTSSALAAGIRYLDPPRLSPDLWKLLDVLMKLHDRVWQIEDADRGEAPSGVIAASAIAALQERNAVLIRHKIRAVDALVRNRGRAFLSFYQNFGVVPEPVAVDDAPQSIVGISLIGRKFSFEVESGSSIHKTTLQTQEQAAELYKLNAIDRQALLENLNFPGWKRIIERVGEGQLEQALQILVQAGLPEQVAFQLKEGLMQPQGGPGQ